MELSLMSILLAAGAGLLSVTSPCVLPVVPIIVTGTAEDHRYRPLLIVSGLSVTFILMGIVTSLFGSVIAGKILIIEKMAGAVVILVGILLMLDINVFKKLTVFNNIQTSSGGRWSGLLLGLTLGLIWIPCIGPMLSGILAMVATHGQITQGVILLAFYSLGFALPMLIVGYSSQLVLQKVRLIQKYPAVIRFASGTVLILFGMFILFRGLV